MKCFLNVFPFWFLIQEYPSETGSNKPTKRVKEFKLEAWNGFKMTFFTQSWDGAQGLRPA